MTWVLRIGFLGILLATGGNIYAEPITTKTSKQPAPFNVPTPTGTLSPTEFKNQVNSLSTQNKAQIDQQVNAMMPKAPLNATPPATLPKPPTAPPATNTSNTPATSLNPEDDVFQDAETNDQFKQSPPPRPTQPPATMQQPAPGAYSTTPATSGTAQPYTGFGAGSAPKNNVSPATTGTTKSQSGGSWNIKY